MAGDVPIRPGDVIEYAYLWGYEASQGHLEGRKDRPCAVMVVHAAERLVGVCPITHTPPKEGQGIQVPPQTLVRLGLDDEFPSWVVTTEINQFVWPGPDIRRAPNGEYTYGLIPRAVFDRIRSQLLENHGKGLNAIHRAED